jgi:hypothetical protein
MSPVKEREKRESLKADDLVLSYAAERKRESTS